MGKNSAGVSVGDGEGDVDPSDEALEVFADWAARSTCSFCTSGISPTRCFSHEQMKIKEIQAVKAANFRGPSRINAGTVMVALLGAQGERAIVGRDSRPRS